MTTKDVFNRVFSGTNLLVVTVVLIVLSMVAIKDALAQEVDSFATAEQASHTKEADNFEIDSLVAKIPYSQPYAAQGLVDQADALNAIEQTQDNTVIDAAVEDVVGVASFTLTVTSDSISTKGRHYNAVRYVDSSCNKARRGSRLFKKKFARDSHEFSDVDIETGEDFIFQINYLENRREDDRLCANLVKFRPLANHRYKAVYDVSGQVSSCSLKVFDITAGEKEVPIDQSFEQTCATKNTKSAKNGVPTHMVHPLY